MPTERQNDIRAKAFLALIRYAEANKEEDPSRYNIKNDRTHFSDMSHHPGPKHKGQHSTSAAGAYQIMYGTYLGLIREGCPANFTNDTQDEMALRLIYDAGALPLIWAGQLSGAISLLIGQWTSLPGGGQPHLTEKEAEAYFWKKVKDYEDGDKTSAVRLDGATPKLNHHNPRTR